MVDCVPGTVAFFGKVDGSHPLALLIKAKSSGISITVKSYDEGFANEVLTEANGVAAGL